ncbi:PEPxxWA-CTERM sorting domain-containing protein [Glacieibacterium frigidum]|uniref:PEP-CTERM sorting domain-containing protein n=1 Tax=Glacieibacterium frigidum TaxID=2593303 RepID=A0A552U7T2_9SPHN|nr:PEPxxWA-CTERM sorting domain-containing protein [Glacieibacterium frigidum]TRW14275.1 PEP-CTERM sorting domain-containing protein [Glacieibacterium frigidum]
MRWLVAGLAAALTLAGPARGAVIHTETVGAFGGEANALNALYEPYVLQAGTTWITVDQGQLTSGNWTINGQLAKLWWDEFGSTDEEGNYVPVLTGNEYSYSPSCNSTLANPVCGTTPLRTTLSGNVLRIDFAPPPDFYNCTPTFVVAGDCAESYSFFYVDFDLFATGVGDEASFTFYDANPVPEPATWALLIAGFGITGTAMRRRRTVAA